MNIRTAAIGCAILAYTAVVSCQNEADPDPARPAVAAKGEVLAAGVCASCHLLPKPTDLHKEAWKRYVLPRMGYFLGIYSDTVTRASLIEGGSAQDVVEARSIFPEEPRISAEDWAAIQAYFLTEAPDALETSQPEAGLTSLFRATRPAFGLQPPSTTMIKVDEKTGNIFLGDALTGTLHVLDHQLSPMAHARTGEAAVWMTESEEAFHVLVMGSFSPTDAPSGKLMSLPKTPQSAPSTVIPDLQRPVHHSEGDLNSDGFTDFVVCEFAKWTGSLSWWKNNGDETYDRMPLRTQPGAIKAYLRDWNSDGLLDIVALFAQGNEGIRVYINNGREGFEEQSVLSFPASFGSSFFQLADLDGDGDEDIVHCAGDNADFGPYLRPYHGIRLFFNDGTMHFPDTVFVPMHGAYQCIPEDFDQDGDLDLAAISFFPDFSADPVQGFLYLENTGGWQFTRTTFPEVDAGRWIVMDKGDPDGDGDIDLVLGSLTFEAPGYDQLLQKWASGNVSFIVLENGLR